MNGDWRTKSPVHVFRRITALICVFLLPFGDANLVAQESTNAGAQQASAQQPAKIPPEQLDSLVAPIALYTDPLLSQTLVASTYPLEIVQLQQWLQQNKELKDKALADAVQKQDWDPSIQAMAALPDVVKLLAENIKWTTDLGNAFLAQQKDVMDAVQRMRNKAKDKGNLKTTEQQKVETKVVESKTVVVIEQADPKVVYVPSYDPVVVYGAPVYAYPPVAYPAGYYAAGMALSFGVGMAMGAAWGGGWGYNCGWGGNNNVTVNRNNTFVNNSNRNLQGGNRGQVNRSNWQHNPQHRGGAPYSDRATANRYGGTARGEARANGQGARQQNVSNRANAGTGAANRQPAAAANRSDAPRTEAANRGGGGGDRVGNRSVPDTPSARNTGAFSGAGTGSSGSGARASSARGASSMGGGGRAGGRGGGGGRRR